MFVIHNPFRVIQHQIALKLKVGETGENTNYLTRRFKTHNPLQNNSLLCFPRPPQVLR